MKKYFLSLSIIFAICFGACKKDNTVTPSPGPGNGIPPANSKVKTAVTGNSQVTYEYNQDGSISKIASNGKPWYDFQYFTDSVIQVQYLSNGSIGEKIHIIFNSDKLATEYWNENYPYIKVKYEYNPDKSMKYKKNFDHDLPSTITAYTFKNGNLVKDSTYNVNGQPNYSRTYEYYTDKISTTEQTNFGSYFWAGFSNKNPLKKITYINDITGSITSGSQYEEPKTDALHRISKITYTPSGSSSPTVTDYTYY